MKKPADTPVDADTSHSNTKKKKTVLVHVRKHVTLYSYSYSSKRNLKAVLLHNTESGSIPIAHSTKLNEN